MVNNDVASPLSTSEDLRAYVSWQHPSRNLCIYLHAETVQMLSKRSLRQSKAVNPSELGGLLWGKFLQFPQDLSGLVLVPALVPSEASSFNTNKNDIQNLINALVQPPQPGLQLIGFFRSHLRDGLSLSEEDESFIKQYIQDPASVFLIIRPFEIGICMAGFFFWEHGHLQTDGSELEIPFIAPENVAGVYGPAEPVEPVALAPSSRISESTSDAPPASLPNRPKQLIQEQAPSPSSFVTTGQPDRQRRFFSEFVLSAAIVSLACLGAYLVGVRLRSPLPPAPVAIAKTEVGLQVKVSSSGQMDLSWDQTSPELQKAQGAKLTIIDGNLHRELTIDRDQLRFGKLTYLPNSGDVQFYLEIHLDAVRSVAESVRVLPKFGGVPTVKEADSAGSSRVPPQYFSPKVAQPTSGTGKRFPVELVRSAIASQAPRPSFRQFATPPALNSGTNAAVDLPKSVLIAPMPLPTPLKAPQKTSLQARVQESAPVPVPPATAAPAYVPSRPVTQVAPLIPHGASATICQPTSVTIQVEIDEKGRVTKAHVKERAPGTNAVLTAYAVVAAKQWKFQPALLHDKNVSSIHNIVFQFRPME